MCDCRLFAEASLDGVETLLRSLRRRVRRVDADILSAVRRQSLGGSKAKMDLESATKAIVELQGRVIDIKVKVIIIYKRDTLFIKEKRLCKH